MNIKFNSNVLFPIAMLFATALIIVAFSIMYNYSTEQKTLVYNLDETTRSLPINENNKYRLQKQTVENADEYVMTETVKQPDRIVSESEAVEQECADHSGVITGCVFDVNGKLSAEIQVEAIPFYLTNRYDLAHWKKQTNVNNICVTDNNGYYQISNIPSGKYKLYVINDSKWKSHSDINYSFPDEYTDVYDNITSVCDIVIKNKTEMQTRLWGIISQQENIVIGAEITFISLKDLSSKSVISGQNGDYSILLYPGIYNCKTNVSCSFLVEVPNIQSYEYNINVLNRRIIGTIIDEQSGKKIVGAHLILRKNIDGNGDSYAEIPLKVGMAVSDMQGRFIINGIPEGRYELFVRKKGYGAIQQAVIINNDETKEYLIVMNSGGKIYGYTYDSKGFPIAGVRFEIKKENFTNTMWLSENALSIESDANGKYSIPALSEDSYEITASKQGYAPSTQTVNIINKVEKQVDFILLEGGTIRLSLLNIVNEPIAGAKVTIHDMPSGNFYFYKLLNYNKTNAKGICILENISPGYHSGSITINNKLLKQFEFIISEAEEMSMVLFIDD